MILRSIRVEGWQCFAEPVPLGPLTDGLNVIHGPNGIGKSTLMMALVRGLFDNHSVGGEAMKRLRPWGRQLNPKVTIQFEQDGVTYRLYKQFLGSATSELSRLEGGRMVPLAEGRAADDQARRILSGESPGRGVTQQRHWGVAQILWAAQGELRIGELSSRVRATIQQALGAQIAGPGACELEQKIADAYHRFFTPGGKLRSGASGPATIGLESRWTAARDERSQLLVRLDEFHAASRRIEDLHHKVAQAEHSQAELNDKLQQARAQARAYHEILARRKLHEQQVRAAEDGYKNLREKIEAIATTRAELERDGERLRRLEDDAPAQAKHLEQCRARAIEARKKIEQVRNRRDQVQAARQTARLADRFITASQTVADVGQRLAQIEAVQGDRQQLCRERDKIVAPDAKTLEQITATARARDDARLRLDASVITVRIEPERNIDVEVTIAEQPGSRSLAPDTAHAIKGDPDVGFRIPGVAAFEAIGPTQGVDSLRRQWEEACAALEDQTAGFGTQDLERLQHLRARAAELESRISAADLKIETLLGDRELDTIRNTRMRAASIVEEVIGKHPAWRDAPPDVEVLESQAEDIEQRFVADIDAAEREEDRAREALNLALQKETLHQSDIKNTRQRIEDINRRLAKLCEDDTPDLERSAALTEMALARDAARGKLDRAIEELASFGDHPDTLVGNLDRQLAGIRQDASDAARQLSKEEGRLLQITTEAPYSRLADVEEEIKRLEDEIARHQIQINAVRLLHDTLAERKRRVLQSVLDPVRLRANRTLQRIAGARFEDIQFDESLVPQRVAPRVAESAVALEQISGGEQEQLHFAVRMALADVTFNGKRQLVVLDDVFTYTDTSRLARIATILDEAADRFQIVLLTCHPERYRGLPNAAFFDLDTIAKKGAE